MHPLIPKVDINLDDYIIRSTINFNSFIEPRLHEINSQLVANDTDIQLQDLKRNLESMTSQFGIIAIYRIDMKVFGTIELPLGTKYKYEAYNIGFDATTKLYKSMYQFMTMLVNSITIGSDFNKINKIYRVHMHTLHSYSIRCARDAELDSIKSEILKLILHTNEYS